MIIEYPGNQYECFTYPAGEMQVRLEPELIPQIHQASAIRIRARLYMGHSIVGLLLLADAIRGVKPGATLILDIPYLPYARADRRFVDGDCFGLETFGRILRLGNFEVINTLDVHNPHAVFTHVSSFLVNNSATSLIRRAVARFAPDAILFPDKGAMDRYRYPPIELPVILATKQRNPETGALSGFTVPDVSGYKRILIIDDICDGGGTFLGIAKAIGSSPILGLCVTHSMFSKGTKVLTDVFEDIYTTDSWHRGPKRQRIHLYDAFEFMDGTA